MAKKSMIKVNVIDQKYDIKKKVITIPGSCNEIQLAGILKKKNLILSEDYSTKVFVEFNGERKEICCGNNMPLKELGIKNGTYVYLEQYYLGRLIGKH